MKMMIALPTLFGLSMENIIQKVDFYRSIGLEFIILTDTKQLMQSVKLSYARCMFLKSFGISITIENYKMLFWGEKKFSKRFGITNQELALTYLYDKRGERNDKNV